MRGRVSVALPIEVTPEQLAAVASLASAIAAGRWEHLARSFGRMDASGARIAPAMSDILDRLGQQLREAAKERAEPL